VTIEQVCILTEEEILSFQRLVKKATGIDLPLAEAENQGSRLIQAMELILENKKIVAKQFQKDENEVSNG